jgi:hypothetical protein
MTRIPISFVNGGARTYEVLVNRFENIIKFDFDQEDFTLKPKMMIFFEFVGNNDYIISQFPQMMQRFQHTDVFLVIDDSYEGLCDEELLEKISQVCKSMPWVTQWRILSSNSKLKDTVVSENFIHFNIHLHLNHYDNIYVDDLEWNTNTQLRQKKFLCVNRQERLHRLQIVDFLLENDLHKDTYLSCMLGEYSNLINKDKETWSKDEKQLRRFLDPSLNDYTLTDAQRERLKVLPIELDVIESQHHAVKVNMPTLEPYFQQSYFSIITEGDYASDFRRLYTEKPLKCFAYGHPFILAGLPGSLNQMHKDGFITFSSVINESYDEEENDERRMSMIKKEILKLSKLDYNEMRLVYESLQEVLQHNFMTYKVLNSLPQPTQLANDILKWWH